jgi:hypothetical protein
MTRRMRVARAARVKAIVTRVAGNEEGNNKGGGR